MSKTSTSVTNLPAAFIRRTTNPLKRKTRGRLPFYRLPFVANRLDSSPARYWNVPATGGYFGGYETGAAMALIFLKYVREEKTEAAANSLTKIVESFMARFEQESGMEMNARRVGGGSDEYESFRGQYVGFFNTASKWMGMAAVQLGARLDGLDERELVRSANAGLGFDEAAYLASLSREDDETEGGEQ